MSNCNFSAAMDEINKLIIIIIIIMIIINGLCLAPGYLPVLSESFMIL
jgi:phage-related protein